MVAPVLPVTAWTFSSFSFFLMISTVRSDTTFDQEVESLVDAAILVAQGGDLHEEDALSLGELERIVGCHVAVLDQIALVACSRADYQ